MMVLAASQALLWAVILVLAATVLALARQIGILHERIAPLGAMVSQSGPAVGERAPLLRAMALDGSDFELGRAHARARPLLLMFVSSACPICKKLIPAVVSFSKAENLDLVFVGDGDVEDQMRMVTRFGLEEHLFLNSPEIGLRLQVAKLPYAVLIGDNDVILAKGLVNSREHLESLVVSQETGFASVQAYLQDHPMPVRRRRPSAPAH